MLKTLAWYRRSTLAVLAGCAVTTAVLTGALVVGDSVRGSLRAMALDRLGTAGVAVLAEGPVDRDLAGDVEGAAPVLLLRGAAVHGESGARASRVVLLGVDDRLFGLWPGSPAPSMERPAGSVFAPVVLNRTLAGELGASVGDDVVLSFPRYAAIPRDSLMGESDTDDVLATFRATVSAVVPDRGPGRFGLASQQHAPRNAFLPFRPLERALEARGVANVLLVPDGPDAAAVGETLDAAMTLDDHGIEVEERDGHLVVESAAFVLRPEHESAVVDAVRSLGLPPQRLVSYLANELRVGDRVVPYSGITGVDASVFVPGSRLVLEDGRPAPALAPDGVYLNRWAADDLRARPGDVLAMTYYVVGEREEVREETTEFRVAGVVGWDGLGGDPDQTPDFPGLDDAEDMAAWDPPFPVDLDRIRDRDEDYWDARRATPKAFVDRETAARLWGTRYGATTQVRMPTPEGGASALEAAILERLDPGDSGLQVRDLREEALAASAGATDFAGLFLGFSWFLIVAAALLVGLLFGLGVESRAREIGLRLAVGFPLRRVRRALLAEALAIAVVGAAIGAALAVGYAALLLLGLRTVWIGAVGTADLTLHLVPATVIGGVVGSLVVVVLAVVGTVLRLSRRPPPRLLAGDVRPEGPAGRARVARVLAPLALSGAIGLVLTAFLTDRGDDPALAFGAGALVLIAGLAHFAVRFRRGSSGRRPVGGLAGMAARNGGWSPGRSLLSVALVACAAFVLVLVGASRRDLGDTVGDRDSGTGGYALVAETDVPLLHDLNTATGRAELGLPPEVDDLARGAAVVPLRALPGDDASCLNLFRPGQPRLVGVPDDFLARGGFRFKAHLALPEGEDDPWSLLALGVGEDGVVPAVADANSAQWILKVGPGDEVTVPDESGEPIRLRIVGLLDTSVFQSELLVPEDAFLDRFPSRTGFGAFLIDVPGERAEELATALEAGLAPFGFDAESTRERLEAYLAVEHTYLSTFQLLGGLGLLLGTVGLAIVMLRNVNERRGELAVLRAFGFRARRIGRLVLAENAFLLVCGVGLGAVSAIVAVLPRLAALDVPWGSILLTLSLVLVVGMLSAAAAVRGALQIPLIPELKADR